jgi:hypothetical protein
MVSARSAAESRTSVAAILLPASETGCNEGLPAGDCPANISPTVAQCHRPRPTLLLDVVGHVGNTGKNRIVLFRVTVRAARVDQLLNSCLVAKYSGVRD